ncbi:MAG TPA: hypothetical protein VGG66_05890, partial [Rhizomicrobium sp.]
MTIKRTIPVLLCSAVALVATLAHADTRDDVLSGIQRCGVIHDDRTWLDCLYGADQPMRARLALPPAPEFQQRLVPAGPDMPLSSMPSSSMPASSMPASVSASPASSVAARPAPRKKAGFWDTLLGNTQPVAVSRMASYRFDRNGAFVVTLDNGQQWRQTDIESGALAPWRK